MFFCDYPIIKDEARLPIYLINMGKHDRQDHIIRTEGYPYPQLLYCTKGGGILLVRNKRYRICSSNAVFLPAHCPHEYYPCEEQWDIHWIVPAGYALDTLLEHFGLTEPEVYSLSETRTLEHIFRKMHEAIGADSLFGASRASGYLYDFLIEFHRLITAGGTLAKPNPALTRAIDYINLYYARPISMDELCRISDVTPQHLCLLFRTTLNSRPMEYIAKRRIRAAKELLTSTNRSIESIAYETGFGSAAYFCKLFKRYEGITPSHFKSLSL